MRLILFLAMLAVAGTTTSATNPKPMVQSGPIESPMGLFSYVAAVPVYQKDLTPEAVLLLPDSAFLTAGETPTTPTAEAWIRFTIMNTSDQNITDLVSACEQPDSVEYFSVRDGRIERIGRSGSRVAPGNVGHQRLRSLIDLRVPAYDSVTVLAHVWLPDLEAWEHVFHGNVKDLRVSFARSREQFTLQAFYSGIMMVFMIISLLMFISFREWVFVTYAFMMLSLNAYFLYYSGIMSAYLLPENVPMLFTNSTWVISGIVLSCSLFITQYLDLRRSMPRYRKAYLILSTALCVFALLWDAWLRSKIGHLNLLNFGLLLWIPISFYPVVRRSLRKEREARVLLVSISLIAVGGMLNTLSFTKILPIPGDGMVPFQLGSLAFSGTLFYGLFTKIRQIQNERAQSDAVLFNVLPKEIATELKESGESEARYLERVTVLFTDFVDFTKVSTSMSPSELVQELNVLFSMFDEIVTRYGLEKIKTIGESYMVAGGLRESRQDEADVVIRAAIEMQRAVEQRVANRTREELPTFTMRAGIHTGPVVAGVVGVVKFQYDIWGDTVNTASRMESAGASGRVNISQATYDLVKDEPTFSFEARGEVDVKGIGPATMWFVDAQTKNAPSAG